jgi:hypothetical protein
MVVNFFFRTSVMKHTIIMLLLFAFFFSVIPHISRLLDQIYKFIKKREKTNKREVI